MTSIPTGQLEPLIQPGSDAWLQRMTASKIAAVIGLSPFESRFSLWHRMAGLVPPEPDSDTLRRGHYLEPATAAWFADQHPEWRVDTTGTWVKPGQPWQAATPDRLVTTRDGDTHLLECKSAADADDWGQPGTDQIPVYYRAQVLWQMDTAGVTRCHIAVLLPYLEFAEYVVDYDPVEAAWLVEQGRAFMDSLPGGPAEQRPDLDAHSATYTTVRQLNPDISPADVDLDPALGEEYLTAVAACKAADENKTAVATRVADAIREGRRAMHAGRCIALRVPGRNGAPPYLKAAPQPKTPRTSLKEAS